MQGRTLTISSRASLHRPLSYGCVGIAYADASVHSHSDPSDRFSEKPVPDSHIVTWINNSVPKGEPSPSVEQTVETFLGWGGIFTNGSHWFAIDVKFGVGGY